ncbi:hypothetical protein D5086_032588 [Populus alba]|uniref:Uncharacterized protein n=1 Tax=Populus alba TaxID=43335 RepID=A0ACC4ALT1_POPAL
MSFFDTTSKSLSRLVLSLSTVFYLLSLKSSSLSYLYSDTLSLLSLQSSIDQDTVDFDISYRIAGLVFALIQLKETNESAVINVAHLITTVIESDLILVLDDDNVLECSSLAQLLTDSTSASQS